MELIQDWKFKTLCLEQNKGCQFLNSLNLIATEFLASILAFWSGIHFHCKVAFVAWIEQILQGGTP